MAAETILIVEDDATLLRGLRDNFEERGFRVRSAADGEQALATIRAERPDLILLDIMLPTLNGYEICRLARRDGLTMPIIMLTAKGQEEDIVLGLNLGADDYVTKPFAIQELLARVNALLRRQRQSETARLRFGEFELDLVSHQLRREQTEVPLTPKEFALLAYMVRKTGHALTRDNILRTVWGDDILVTTRSVDRCINTLRGKIEADPHRPRFITTIREIGYRFEIPDDAG
ncbi:MAG: response regulator transcription factor [Planctomycetia bacterium]|nr:MAG: response regulator transcription factor [Planctomycetia bacterium]